MKYLLNKANGTKEYIKMSTDNMSKILTPNFIEVYNCIIIDTNNEIKAENIDFERILLTFQDRTGYEDSCNEVRLNDYIDCYDEMGLLKTAEIIMKVWEKKLVSEYPQYRFCIILSFSEGYATLRFHMIRENEKSWLKSDLETYKDEAIMVQEFQLNDTYTSFTQVVLELTKNTDNPYSHKINVQDGHGSVTALVENSKITYTYTYDSHGIILKKTGDTDNGGYSSLPMNKKEKNIYGKAVKYRRQYSISNLSK